MTTGERIAKARKNRDLTQEKMAEILGISPQAVSSWERDEYLPDTKNLIALADALDVTLDSLLREDTGWRLNPVNYKAITMGYKAVLVEGNPKNYNPRGFVTSADHGIIAGPDIHLPHVSCLMIKELVPGALEHIHGMVDYSFYEALHEG